MVLTNKEILENVEKLISDPETQITIKNKSFGPSQKMRHTQYGTDNNLNQSDELSVKKQIDKYNDSGASDVSILFSADESFLKSNLSFLNDIYNKTLDTTRLPELLSSDYWTDMLLQLDLVKTNFEEKTLVFSRATLVLPTIFHNDIEMKINTSMVKIQELIALQPNLFKQKLNGKSDSFSYYPKVPGFEDINRSEYHRNSVVSNFIAINDTSEYNIINTFSETLLVFLYDYILSRYDLHFAKNGQIKILPLIEDETQQYQDIPHRIREVDDFIKPYIDQNISEYLSDSNSFDHSTLTSVLQIIFPTFLTTYSETDHNYSLYSSYDQYLKISHVFEYSELDSTATNSDLEKINNLFHRNAYYSRNSNMFAYNERHNVLLNKSQTNKNLEIKPLFQFEVNSDKSFDVIEHTQYKNTATLLSQLEDMTEMNCSAIRNKKLLITDDGIMALHLSRYNNNLTLTLF